MQEQEIKKKIVSILLEKNILISPELLEQLQNQDIDSFLQQIQSKLSSEDLLVINNEINKIKKTDVNWQELEKSKALSEKGKNQKIYSKFIKYAEEEEKQEPKTQSPSQNTQVKVVSSYKEESKKRDVQDFVSYFNARYRAIEKLLRNRQELQNIMSINRILNKTTRETISLIGMVKEKNYTKNGNLMLVLEDTTGCIKTLVNKTKPELFNAAKDIVLDETIGVVGANGQNIVFANNMIWPDIPIKELKKSPKEAYAIFLSDLHVGSKQFLPKEFNRFLDWINQRTGTPQQREIASKVKYIFILGDLVDGCGIYPEQDTELEIEDIYQQYEACASLLKQIPSSIQLIICPGNHDAMRIAEPQLELYKDFAKSIWELPNITMISNPAMVNIHSSEKFDGFDILVYHGYSFDYYVANVDSIRNQGGYDRADLIMSFLLQRRHLAPTYKSTLCIPDTEKDPLVINQIPDFFVTGHIHKSIAANYKNITLISGSCWQSKTTFQEKVGHNPEPARIPIVNLQTRQIKILKF
ncbi:DNA-directed DNA polymerase II small subunit [Candidatus Woesearchaeota archaeon]|nr:DNA-directed DNA polymerase II small subunit [Candidatus Woesearchaeota archaeon]